MWLAGASLRKILKAAARHRLLSQAHLVELLLCHLHKLALILNLALGHLKRLLVLQVCVAILDGII